MEDMSPSKKIFMRKSNSSFPSIHKSTNCLQGTSEYNMIYNFTEVLQIRLSLQSIINWVKKKQHKYILIKCFLFIFFSVCFCETRFHSLFPAGLKLRVILLSWPSRCLTMGISKAWLYSFIYVRCPQMQRCLSRPSGVCSVMGWLLYGENKKFVHTVTMVVLEED